VKVTMLGTGAPLHPTRAGTGLLVQAEGLMPLLIDTCGGLELARQLAWVKQPIEEIKHVIVTHKHGDHIGGVMALALARVPCTYYGLADSLEAIKEILATTYGEYDMHPQTQYEPIETSRTYRIAGYEVSFFAMQHRVPTVAVRILANQKTLAFSADSLPCPNLINCAKDADLFICDAICASSDYDAERIKFLMHPTSLEAAHLAKEARVKALALTHLARFANSEAMLNEARSLYTSATIPNDGDVFYV
jgi:ribonuclease BN (tRNA processing enzyme)